MRLNTVECLWLHQQSFHDQYGMDASRADTNIADETAIAPVLYCVFSSKP